MQIVSNEIVDRASSVSVLRDHPRRQLRRAPAWGNQLCIDLMAL
jgi:hypothetical protein